MKKLLLKLLAILVAAPPLASVYALDLTPHELTGQKDIVTAGRYFFQDSFRRMGFRLDSQMSVSGSGDSVGFQFADIKNAAMKIVRSSKTPDVAFEEKNAEVYRQLARAFVPGHAEEVVLEFEKANAIAINDWTSYQYTFTYKLFGFPYRRTISFLNYSDKEQFVVDVSAPAPDFDRAYWRGYSVLNSLSEMQRDGGGGPT